MSELKKEVKTYMISKMCKCGGTFQYEYNGVMLATYPPQYTHVCDACGNTEMFNCVYPKIEYEYIEGE